MIDRIKCQVVIDNRPPKVRPYEADTWTPTFKEVAADTWYIAPITDYYYKVKFTYPNTEVVKEEGKTQPHATTTSKTHHS